jgi:hypothetical protein
MAVMKQQWVVNLVIGGNRHAAKVVTCRATVASKGRPTGYGRPDGGVSGGVHEGGRTFDLATRYGISQASGPPSIAWQLFISALYLQLSAFKHTMHSRSSAAFN